MAALFDQGIRNTGSEIEETPVYVVTENEEGIYGKLPFSNVSPPDISGKEDKVNKSDSYTTSSSITYASSKALVDGLGTKINISEKGAVNGVAALGSDGKVLDSQIKIATDAETQINASVTEDNKVVTRLKLYNWFNWIKSGVITWTAKQTFSLSPRFNSTTINQFLRVDGNKDLVSVSEVSDAEMQAGTENTKPTTALRITNWFNWRLNQGFTFGNLSGMGTRVVQVNSLGDMSAPFNIQDGFTADSDVITALTTATYNSGNNFTASLTPANSKVFNQGQFYKNAGVIYFATADNQASRITLS